MVLYDSPVSGNCYKVRLLLALLGIPYEIREVDVVDRSNRPELLGDLNPALRVPTLVLDDGRALGEPSPKYQRIAPDSPSARPSSSTSVGTRNAGFRSPRRSGRFERSTTSTSRIFTAARAARAKGAPCNSCR